MACNHAWNLFVLSSADVVQVASVKQMAAMEAAPEWTLDQIAGLGFGVRA